MTISDLSARIGGLLHLHPLADTNVDHIENVGTDIHFATDDLELADLRDQLIDREKEVADLEAAYNACREHTKKLESKLNEIERKARIT